MLQVKKLVNCYCEASVNSFNKLLELGYALPEGMVWFEDSQDRFLIKPNKIFSPIHEKNEYAHGNATFVFLLDNEFHKKDSNQNALF